MRYISDTISANTNEVLMMPLMMMYGISFLSAHLLTSIWTDMVTVAATMKNAVPSVKHDFEGEQKLIIIITKQDPSMNARCMITKSSLNKSFLH